ncbi:related to TOM1 protein [Phialocephala subalpina]|uniref:HECT-type E3 ubiquitin transferase n=1 Tax=Phialocephala subalpina TaxID=576137 RepID=A0A1L7WIN4_9HELO|nr:related to TOM1 protein [Phialocephala subalpina]
MVRITKTMQTKHSDSLSPWIKEFRNTASSMPLPLLPQYLATFPSRWPFPRGDLYHWIPLLNRFDEIYEQFAKTYKLDDGPQMVDFACTLLLSKAGESDEQSQNGHNLEFLGYSQEGDRELVEALLGFTVVLLQNCGNRSIYGSSANLNHLLNTTSLSLLEATLRLGSELAQRYQAALKRAAIPGRQISHALLLNHYNIDLDRVQQLSAPFSKTITAASESTQLTTPATPTVKGKEKAYFNTPTQPSKGPSVTVHANDLVSMVKGGPGVNSSPKSVRNGVDTTAHPGSWEDWGDVKITYYPKPSTEPESSHALRPPNPSSPSMPITPTPVRRSSNLGPHGQRANRQSVSDDSSPSLPRSSTFPSDDTPRPSHKVIEISSSTLRSVGIHTLLREHTPGLPQELQYELLTKLRVASALTYSLETRRQILAVRLLAITNLSYIYVLENTFLENVLKQDSDEPRRMQLVYQLAELVHPPPDGEIAVPRPLQTLAFNCLDGLCNHQSKFTDVCAALNTNVNHGVLLYVVRKAVAEMGQDDTGDKLDEEDEWREALFSLLSNLSINPRTGGEMVTAGLIPILVEVLTLRSTIAERYHPMILTFLDAIMYSTRDAFQTLVSAEGLDTVSDLIVYEVNSAKENAAAGKGMKAELRSGSVDYQIPFFQQQTLKWLFKFIHHMMSSAGVYGGNFDRLLRNLIDSSALLSSLRQIIGDATCFGSIVWTNAVSILNDFINNEPTSFAVIAEAGLSRGLLEAITGTPITIPADKEKSESQTDITASASATDAADGNDGSSPAPPSEQDDGEDEPYNVHRVLPPLLHTPRASPLARGILPTSETINIIPQAFGAICLNNSGMKMFQASNALETFFEIFESPEHVKCMESNKDLPSNLGSTFDELVRHHPQLKEAIMNAILVMVGRVEHLCATKAHVDSIGAKLWTTDAAGKPVVADQHMKLPLVDRSVKGKGKVVEDSDVEMQDADVPPSDARPAQPATTDITSKASTTPYITAVSTFLSAMFGNSGVRADFATKGGLEFVLGLASSPSLSYDFADTSASRTIHQVIALLAETKPHLVLPSLLKHAQAAADALEPFATHSGSDAFFAPFINPDAQQSADIDVLAKGTSFAKAFVNLISLVATINSCFQASIYNHRSSNSIFTSTNVNDYYIRLVRSLGPLLGSSIKEEILLQKCVPEQWKSTPRVKDTAISEPVVEPSTSSEQPTPTIEVSENDVQPSTSASNAVGESANVSTNEPSQPLDSKKPSTPSKLEQDSSAFKNYQSLRYLLAKMPRTIQPVLQTLGKAVVTKRNPDSFQKQYHLALADALVESIMSQLVVFGDEASVQNFTYWGGLLNVVNLMLIDESRQNDRPIQTITLIVQAFKDHGGLETLNHMLEVFAAEIRAAPSPLRKIEDQSSTEYQKLALATAGVKAILAIYSQLVNGKNVTEALQTIGLTSRAERDRSRPDHFSAGQLIVELRMAVLPAVRRLWESDLIEKGDSQISEKIIDVIRLIAAADCESGAVKRADKPVSPPKPAHKQFKPNQEYRATLLAHAYPADLVDESLYRCNNNIGSCLEYCRLVSQSAGRVSHSEIPTGDIATPEATPPSRPETLRHSRSTGTSTPDEGLTEDQPMSGTTSGLDASATIDQAASGFMEAFGDMTGDSDGMDAVNRDAFQSLLQQLAQNGASTSAAPAATAPVTQPAPPSTSEDLPRKQVTVEDLNEERDAVRDNLIDKCLDAINAHGEVTFEVADLITAVVNKSSDPSAQRERVGETLVIALMSFAGEDDLRTSGKKVAAYAHLLALMLRDKLFYAAAVSELKDNLSTLLSFVKLSPNHSADEPSPWIAHILLIIEILLSEDEKPQKTKWTPPKNDDDVAEPPVLELSEPTVSKDERSELLEAILDILPRIGKDESLALAVLRILVILTRTRAVAQSISDKKNIQRLFVMAKQLAGASSTRIQGPLMLILRHIIEDDETIKQIMRAEIKAFLETNRQQRNIDEKHYIRGLAHVAVRNPELFVEVTNEMVKFNRWTYPSVDGQSRHHSLVLKETHPEPTKATEDATVQPTVQATEDLTIQDVKPSTEAVDSEMPDAAKPVAHEQKLPVIENPDGVIHFLLCELLNYRDVEDKDPSIIATASEETGTQSNGGVAMADPAASTDSSSAKDAKTSKPSSKQDFKAEDHPIYIYRCFILQCLTELLASYNRTKIEFINFKRSAPPQAMTPSKPRSSVVNYLLFDLIPVGTLDHAESTSMRKKLVTSAWADSVLTALLCKTGEQPIDKEREPYNSDSEPDLLFVRRFVLENILKAYKEASSSTENLDVKYARMLALADLMNHIMNGKENVGMSDTAVAATSQKQLRRIMFEKGYVSALTASIADIDLNFPSAKRAVKYILRPLKTLTTTAVNLSDLALISDTPGEGEEAEIESATSLSEPEDDREETPDLFRNSTLGMFEQGREGDSTSESGDDDDEEMYEGEYDDEMDYEEEPVDAEDGISDEDEEIEGMGPIEGLSGDHNLDVEVILEEDDDDEDDEDDSSDDDDDDDDEHDSEDDDARVEIIDEAGNVQQLAEDDDMGEWESDEGDEDGEEEDYEGQAADQEEEQLHAMEAMGGPLGHLVRALGGDDAAADILERMEAEGVDMDAGDDDERVPGEYAEEDDEEGDEDDEDDMDEEEMLFDQYPMDGPGFGGGWQEDVEPPTVVHRRPRGGGFSPFPSLFPGGPRDPLGVPGDYRSSRLYRSNPPGGAASRSQDEGINPLLQRGGSGAASRDGPGRIPSMGGWIQAMGGPNSEILDIGLGRPFGEPATRAILDEVMRSLPPLPGHIARHGHALQFHITTSPGHQLPPDLQAMFGMRPPRFETRRENAEPGSVASFTPQSTAARWLEESKLLFGATGALERAADLTNAILSLLVPPAIEADKAIKAAEAERLRKLEEEAKKKQEEERIAREKKEEEERIAREKKEAEEREAAERAAAEAAAARAADPENADEETESAEAAPDAMDGVETEIPQAADDQAEEPAADRPRIMTMMRGSPFDITDLGIDPDFLAELPEDLREEVIMSTVAERRQQAAATGAQPSEIDQEFLDALPDDIRDEIIQQERQDRRRREREERQRQNAAANGGAGDMDPASILATLPPALRTQVLLEQDEETLAMLPQELADQARAEMRAHPGHGRMPGFAARRVAPPAGEGNPASAVRPPRRAIVQMLDKPGVATLLRLMFIFQHGSLRTTLNSVLQNISLNRHNRNEVLSTLLHILQDGSVDMSAVERSFAHLSLKAKQPKDAQPKTPQPQSLKKAFTGLGPLTTTTLEASPLMVVQQCLSALVYLNQVNPHIPAFFLTEHDSSGGLKRSLSRKGKSKENKAAKYALNSLLSLLGRDLIMESSTVMETLSSLLNMVTSPLQALQRKQKEAVEVKKPDVTDATPSVTDTAPSVTSPEPTTTTTEQPSAPQTETAAAEVTTPVDQTPAQPSTSAEGGEPSISTDAPKPESAKEKEPEKKQRPITPPVIPEQNLKLVINIFVARECSSKTFRDTLSTIKNLSTIPDAKAVFGRELIAKAQELGEVILVDLDELLPQIKKASTGTEIQGVALAKFSPGGSDQNKLLRVLTALDHLFDPKREKKDNETEGESSQLVEKQDLLSSLYENPTFGRMWERLSACLSAIRQREHLLNVATILLPLIEALMVVCKNTTLKDAPLARSQMGKEMMLTSPPPESQMESLFFTFTEEHRKILNDLVRQTPKLMSGTFSLLVKNPKVLEFDNKRNYFSRSIHAKAPNSRQSFPPLQLSVRRDQVFHDSFKSLYFQTGDQMKYGKLSIRFHGEEGVDAGGVTREWFQVLSRQMFDPGYALFIPVSSDRTTFHPNQLSSINEEHLMFFKFIGRIIGKALYEGRVLDCHFSRAVYKRILGKAVSVKDMESLDPDYYKSLVWMLENDITDIITETFSVDNDKFGVVETIDFIPNGRNIPVTEENKQEYVRLMVEWKLTGSVKEQLDEFLKGFHDIIPADLVAIFNEQELELLISGLPEIDVDDWKGNTEYHNYTASSPQIQWFWRAVRSFDKEERAKLLQFVTGTSKVPLNGFQELEGMNGFSRFNIHRDYGNKDRLPSSHTCFNQLDLPEYESYEVLRQQVLTAITAGSEYFGFA